MNGPEAIAARQKLALSTEQLGAELGFTPAVVEAWERGSVKVPGRAAKDLAWRTAYAERTAALESSGLATCDLSMALYRETVPEKAAERAKYFERIVAHAKSCETCIAREKYVDDRFGPMPPKPMPGWLGVLVWIGERVDKLPPLARPAAWGAIAFGFYSIVRVLVVLPGLIKSPSDWPAALLGVAASAAIGGALGFLYGLYKRARS